MRVLIVGAGAAGLSLAAVLGESEAPFDVTVVERGYPDERPGFGITLREEATSFLGLVAAIPSAVHLVGRAFWLAGEAIVDLPNPASTHLICFSRAAFITALVERCTRSGVRFRYGCDVAELSDAELDGYDLVVAADGADSAVRRRYHAAFRPRVELGRNRYGWFGVNRPLPKLTIMLPANNAALAWGYMYGEDSSTFIVECTDEQFDRAGLGALSADGTAREISRMFDDELDGASVETGDAARWRRFGTVTNERLQHRHVVLIGDAAHTTHFSQGIGTMFAFDDVLTLQSALLESAGVPEALAAYEAAQQPKIAEYQEIALASMRWSEDLLDRAGAGDDDAVRALIDARWPGNSVPPGPLGSGDRS